MRTKVGFFLIITFFILTDGFAQNTNRIEIEVRPGEPQPEIIPIENKGFILFLKHQIF